MLLKKTPCKVPHADANQQQSTPLFSIEYKGPEQTFPKGLKYKLPPPVAKVHPPMTVQSVKSLEPSFEPWGMHRLSGPCILILKGSPLRRVPLTEPPTQYHMQTHTSLLILCFLAFNYSLPPCLMNTFV